MNASKETGQHALENLLTQERFMNPYGFQRIKEFIEAAIRKLPTEAAYAKEKTRTKRVKKVK